MKIDFQEIFKLEVYWI